MRAAVNRSRNLITAEGQQGFLMLEQHQWHIMAYEDVIDLNSHRDRSFRTSIPKSNNPFQKNQRGGTCQRTARDGCISGLGAAKKPARQTTGPHVWSLRQD